METYETIREFWFGPNTDDKAVVEDRSRLWWSKNPATDKDMRQRFETMMTKAANHELASWAATPGGCLALILLRTSFQEISIEIPQGVFHLIRWRDRGVKMESSMV